MKKIIFSILGILLTVGVVAGVGYALFNTTVTMSGMVLGTGTPGLQIGIKDNRLDQDSYPDGEAWGTTLNFSAFGQAFKPLTPGGWDRGEFYLKNTTGDVPVGPAEESLAVDFELKARITSNPGGDWDLLRNVIMAKICVFDESANQTCGETQTASHTLNYWKNNWVDFGDELLQGTQEKYTVVFEIPSTYGNEIKGLTTNGIEVSIVGTQIDRQ